MLGLVASGKRNIRSGAQYEKYFTTDAKGIETVLLPNGNVYDTLKLMRSIVNRYQHQTKAIAKVLKGKTIEATCSNIWSFLYWHVQYKKDHAKREQLRQPIRTWRDRKEGVDCDCYSIFIASVLTNLGIPNKFRMAGYGKDFQHVYVVVPIEGKIKERSTYYVIDPVVNRFDYEVPFNKKHDEKIDMPAVTMLSGLGECTNSKPDVARLRRFVDTQQIIDMGMVPTEMFLKEKNIAYAPAFNNETDQSVYVVTTANGPKALPTVLTKEQSALVLEQVNAPAPTTPAEPIKDALKKFNWWWVAGGAAVWLLLTGEDQNEVKSGLNGLAGVPPRTVKRKAKRTVKRYKTLHL